MIQSKESEMYKWGVYAVVALFSFFILYLNLLHPYLVGDDYIFQLKIPKDGILGTERINSISDLVESQINFYNNYHYRVLNHTLLQIVLLFPQWIFDVLNTFVFFLIPLIVTKVNKSNSQRHRLSQYLAILFLIWIFHFNLGWCYFPATGALNYTWMLVPQLLYLVFLLDYRNGVERHSTLILLAVLNSMANENVCISFLVLTFLVAIETRARRKSTLWICLAIIIFGGIFMLSSPSVGKRLATQGHRDSDLIHHLMEYGRRVAYYLIRYSPILVLLIFTRTKFTLNRKNMYLIACLILATGIMIIVPLFEPRSAIFGFFVCLLLVTSLIGSKEVKVKYLASLGVVALILCFIRTPDFMSHSKRHSVNEQILKKQNNQRTAYLEPFCDRIQRGYLLCHEINESPYNFDNRTLGALHNINEVKLDSQFVNRYRSKNIFKEFRERNNYLESYSKIASGKNLSAYSKTSKEGIDIILESDSGNETPFYIVRGKRKGLCKQLFVSVLPTNLQIYFLDYLEDNTVVEQETYSSGVSTYNYIFIPNRNNYDYLLLSDYSFETHAPVGEMLKVELGVSNIKNK